ncbi:hypothetical protein PSPO01_15870 [Paraphaeosphaeria sporulosa]
MPSPTAKRDWHHSARKCCSPVNTCCLGWWCPCLLYGRTRQRLFNQGNVSSSCNSDCVNYSIMACLGMARCLNCSLRGHLRRKHHLSGNGGTDCMRGCFCTPCDLIQQEKECAYWYSQPVDDEPGKNPSMQYQRS